MSVEFVAWPKITRSGPMDVVITEKIDGSNGCLIVQEGQLVGIQSRNVMLAHNNKGELTRYSDNFGFVHWALPLKSELERLGDGYHYGEWAGPGIRDNPHRLERKTFFLFNTFRPKETLPDCVTQVPVLYDGPLEPNTIEEQMVALKQRAEEQGYKPEGVITYYKKLRTFTKTTFEFSEGKWKK